ncbi:LppC putative lipoprotein [Salmonella sp. NCTC 11881]|nr:LppC putative lipoprotein [Salmonella sp. NCTC 11881]
MPSQGRPSLTLLRALIAQEPLLAAKDKQKNIDATWQALSAMTPDQARTLVINADENVLQGWLDLQRVWFDNRNDPDMLKAGIADWQKTLPAKSGGENAADAARQCTNVSNRLPPAKSLCCCR